MKKELPKLRTCIICGKLFEPRHEKDYTHPECYEEWKTYYDGLKEKQREKKQ